jgi:endonuclease I
LIGQSFAFNCPVTPAEELPNYYESIDGTSGKQLLDAIQKVAKIGYRTDDFRYDSVWLAYKYTDLRPDGYIWEIYSDCVFEYEKDRTSATSQTDECKGYNREHAMCQSWFGTTSLAGKEMSSSKKNSPGSDIFHIYPTASGMNSRRGNRPYGEVSQSNYTSGNGSKYGTSVSSVSVENSVAGTFVEGSINMSTNVFEPADEYKGDIARSYFGTMVKWAGEWAFNKAEEGRVIFDATIDADTHYGPENNYGFTDYGLALMLSWHRQDPVSQKEVDRNNGIQKTQGNRNPFIDYPYLAEFIWGEMSGQVLDFDQLLCSADERFELGVSNGYLGEVQDVQMDTIFWMVGNTQYACTYHRHGSKLKNMSAKPTSCSTTSTTFMGWTDAPIQGQVAEAPMVLYDQAADFPAISSHMRYYAVFAEEIRSEVTSETITLSKTDSTNWTLTKLKQTKNNTDGAYWLLVKEASITSPVIDLQTLDSIAMIIRSYQSKKTVSFSADGVNLGKVVAATNTMQRYVWNAPELEGNTTLTFTGEDATAAYGAGVKEVTIYIGGQRGTYTNYLTHCTQGPATDLPNIEQTTNIQKIFHNGQLYVQINNLMYDSMGRVVK